eukprot:TRINITY_DN26369_c0_g2_i2.p1 TRINITY_DN26369_c0_g2~~TRINITY_DN26369_c0_g2_i2.p1  ORF type:complete len:217 (+),score=36.96 TRINITY_DN26369_c0_g2_i2:116-766(+)
MMNPSLGAVLAAVVGAAVFADPATLSGPFLYDDRGTVKVNPVVSERDSTPWTEAFSRDFWGQPMQDSDSHKSFRPVTTLSYRMNAAWWGMEETFSFHMVNVVLHAMVSGLAVLGSEPWLNHPTASTMAGLLFATHPIHTEAVSNVTGRAEVLCALWYLVGFVVYVHGCPCLGSSFWSQAGATTTMLGCTALAMLSKEQGVMLPATCVVWDLSLIHI